MVVRKTGRERLRARGQALRERGQALRQRVSESAARDTPQEPYLALVYAPAQPTPPVEVPNEVTVATYNVHRWTGINGRARPDPARAGFVISELDADVIALQEVLRPSKGPDPLLGLADALGMYLAFAVSRQHRRGQLGNAILSRFPTASASVMNLTFSRIERRTALAVQFGGAGAHLGVVSTHLALVDRTRRRQVEQILNHPQLSEGAAVLMGDMNAWRNCKATRALDASLKAHHNQDWPPSFPAARPMLSLDRIYARQAKVLEVEAVDTAAAKRASDHLPVLARIALPEP
ncbi:MAG: endonuclease/exonuclease/phosphatase family protein [Proteobacteria bacterium]|nr:endonuclease/exonuclease/phosphatase family protein [Pseudomonadota bacterium]